MRSDLGPANALERAIGNMVLAAQEDAICIPRFVALEDLLWKFAGSEDPKPITNCSPSEMLEVIKGLIGKIAELEDAVKVQESAKQALIDVL